MASIRKRSWRTPKGERREAWVVRYADQDGVWRLKTFSRKGEAQNWQATALHEVKQGTHRPDSTVPTLGAAAEAWIRRGEADQLERSTMKQRRQHVDLHILPLLGRDTKLSKIDVDQFRDDLLRTRSRAMAKKAMTSLKAILRLSRVAHLAADVKKIETGGRHKKHLEVGRDIPSQTEIQALLQAATGHRWLRMRALLAVAVFCGLRMSEIRALRWENVDLWVRRQLHVRQRADKWCQIGPLKTETSRRTVPLSPFVANTLESWQIQFPMPGSDLVFPNGRGNVESLPNIWNRHFAPLQVAAGVVDERGKPKYGMHSLRHFFASWLIAQNFNIKRISVLLGHSSPVVTLNVYAHLLPADDDHEKFAAGEIALVS